MRNKAPTPTPQLSEGSANITFPFPPPDLQILCCVPGHLLDSFLIPESHTPFLTKGIHQFSEADSVPLFFFHFGGLNPTVLHIQSTQSTPQLPPQTSFYP